MTVPGRDRRSGARLRCRALRVALALLTFSWTGLHTFFHNDTHGDRHDAAHVHVAPQASTGAIRVAGVDAACPICTLIHAGISMDAAEVRIAPPAPTSAVVSVDTPWTKLCRAPGAAAPRAPPA